MRTITLKKTALVLALAGGAALPMMAQAENAPWLVRVRAVQLESANKDTTGLDLSVNDKLIPELDVSYFFTPQIAAELVLTYPQKHKLYSSGAEIGTLRHLPPTLTLQYHFTGLGACKPYVGAGFNYTHFSTVEFTPAAEAALHPSISKDSFGTAWQVGMDHEISKNVYLNVDVKKVYIRTNVRSSGAPVPGRFKVDPVLIGLGLGYRF